MFVMNNTLDIVLCVISIIIFTGYIYYDVNKIVNYFDDTEKFQAVCLQGKIIVHVEEYYKALLWTEGDEQYYPDGIGDKDYCVLEFVAESARYYGFGENGSGDISQKELAEYDAVQELKNFWGELS